MAKHVFKFGWGRLEHLGDFVKETDKTVTFLRRWGSNSRETRNDKVSSMRIVETDNPKDIVSAFEAEWAKHDDEVKSTLDAHRKASDKQKSAAFKAAFGEDA